MKLTEQQVKEVAENLDCGLRCYYNKKTAEIKSVINTDSWIGADEELWEDELNELEENWADYIEIEGMSSEDAFNVMADFAENVDNPQLQERLIQALNRPKPFSNFKWQIDNSGDYRQQWFQFKNMRYIEWVKEQVDIYNRTAGDE